MTKNSISFNKFLIEELKDDEIAREFLNASLESYIEDNDFSEFARSLEYVIKSRESVSEFAREAGLNRSNLYDIFSNKNKPQFETIIMILSKLGFHLKVA